MSLILNTANRKAVSTKDTTHPGITAADKKVACVGAIKRRTPVVAVVAGVEEPAIAAASVAGYNKF